jgi:TIR domain
MDNQNDTVTQPQIEQSNRRPNALVFISHDSRDAEIAEAFSRLISSVSAGVLKSFRSSDKKGNQGIEYGIEWYPEIMKKLETASDVVCLLTPNSINRPWILFEAGVAKGKLNTPVQGVALGVSLAAAASGPFAQFHNLDDEVDSLTRLVIQLVGRIPGAEPDRDVVKMQVEAFKQKVQPLLDAQKSPQNQQLDEKQEETSVAKTFEEIKVMFQDLPGRIERRVDADSAMNRKRIRKMHPMLMNDVMHVVGKEFNEHLAPLIIGSFLKDDFPWLHEVAAEVYRKLEAGQPDAIDSLHRFTNLFDRLVHHPLMREMNGRSKNDFFETEDMLMTSRHMLDKLVTRLDRNKSGLNAEALDKNTRTS